MQTNLTLTQRLVRGDLAVLLYFPLLKTLVHLLVNLKGGYGIFRDEYYYLACAENLDIGYVDHPPLSVYILKISTLLFGDSLFAIRLVPALAAGITAFFIGLIAFRLGGKRLAILLACIYSLSPLNFAMSSFYSMNSLEVLSWIVTAYLVILIIQTGDKKYWWILGVVLGLGLLNKIGVLFLGAGIFAGLLLTKERKWLATPWPYVAGAIAFMIFLPYIIWNIQHDFAHLEFIHNASAFKYSSLSVLSFLTGQVLQQNPLFVLIWIAGLFALFFYQGFREYRMLGYLYLVPLIILLANGTSKAEYLGPAYGVLWAAAAVWIEQKVKESKAIKYGAIVVTTLGIAVMLMVLPMVLPILPVEKFIRYAKSIGFEPDSSEGKELSKLPQFYADMFGWEEKVKDVAKVFHSLPPEDQAKCAIFATNYGRSASLDYFRQEYNLPRTIGNHNNYWIWGTRGYTGEVMIILGGSKEDHEPNFAKVTLAETSDCDYCMPYENHLPIYICRGIKQPLQEIWPEEKHYE